MKRAGSIREMSARTVTELTGIYRQAQRAGILAITRIYVFPLSIIFFFEHNPLALCLHYLRILAALLTYI